MIRHAGELRSTGRLHRPVQDEVIYRILECSDPHHGFARIYCVVGAEPGQQGAHDRDVGLEHEIDSVFSPPLGHDIDDKIAEL